MAEGGGNKENEARKKMQEATVKLFQKRTKEGEIVNTEQGRIAMPSLSHKWQTIIDDTLIPQIHSLQSDTVVRKRSKSITPEPKPRPLSMPNVASPLPFEIYGDGELSEQIEIPVEAGVVEGESPRRIKPPARLTPLGNEQPPPPTYEEAVDESKLASRTLPFYGQLWQMGRRWQRDANILPQHQARSMENMSILEPMGYSDSRSFSGAKPLPPIEKGDQANGAMKETSFADIDSAERRHSFLSPPETGSRGAVDVEEGRGAEDEPECDNCIGKRFPRVARYLKNMTLKRILIMVTIVTVIIGVILFLGLFPASFVYVEYHEMALLKNKVTGTVYRDEVYFTGCYVLGPDKEFIRYPVHTNTISETTDVYTVDKLEITLSFHLQYYLRSSELGELHKEYEKDYNEVIQKVVISEIKNNVGRFNLDYFRLSRPNLEKYIFNVLKARLNGDCCQSCCPSNCVNNTACVTCLPASTCHPGYHVDIKYFQLTGVVIPDEVSNLFVRKLVLQVEAEKEYLVQDHAVVVKETERKTKSLKNEANEILEEAKALAAKTVTLAEADHEANITSAYVYGLQYLYLTLGVNNEDHKLSLMMMRALEDVNVRGNLYRGYGYNTSTILSSL